MVDFGSSHPPPVSREMGGSVLADRSGAEQNKASPADEYSKRNAAQSRASKGWAMYIEQSGSGSVHRQRN